MRQGQLASSHRVVELAARDEASDRRFNSNPLAVAPDSGKVAKGWLRYLRVTHHSAIGRAPRNPLGLKIPSPKAFNLKNNPGASTSFRGLVTTDSVKTNGFHLEPPDQGLCVTSNWVLEGVNDAYQLYDSSGHPQYPIAIASNTFYNIPVFTEDGQNQILVSDPKCFHDPVAHRWYATAITYSVPGSPPCLEASRITSAS